MLQDDHLSSDDDGEGAEGASSVEFPEFVPASRRPCVLCPHRMAIPGSSICTVCDAVALPAMVPDSVTTAIRYWNQ